MKRSVGPVFCTLRAMFDKAYSNDFMDATDSVIRNSPRNPIFRMGILTLVDLIQIFGAAAPLCGDTDRRQHNDSRITLQRVARFRVLQRP